jgi:hypothetical protein
MSTRPSKHGAASDSWAVVSVAPIRLMLAVLGCALPRRFGAHCRFGECRVTYHRKMSWLRLEAGAKASATLVSAAAALCLLASPATAGQANGLGQAKAALLQKSDFGSGWSSQGSVTTNNGGGRADFFGGTQVLQQFATCIGVNPALVSLTPPTAKSPVFQSKGGTFVVQDYVGVYPSTTLAKADYAAFASPKGPACLTGVMQGAIGRQQLVASLGGKGIIVGNATVTRPKPSWLVPHSAGLTMSVPLTIQGMTANAVVTVVVMVRGRMASDISITSVGQSFSASLAHHLVATAYRRI